MVSGKRGDPERGKGKSSLNWGLAMRLRFLGGREKE